MSLFGASYVKMGALLGPTRFRRGGKMEQLRTKSIQSMKNYDQERFQKQHPKIVDLGYKNTRQENVEKKVFTLYLLHFKRFRGVTEIYER